MLFCVDLEEARAVAVNGITKQFLVEELPASANLLLIRKDLFEIVEQAKSLSRTQSADELKLVLEVRMIFDLVQVDADEVYHFNCNAFQLGLELELVDGLL